MSVLQDDSAVDAHAFKYTGEEQAQFDAVAQFSAQHLFGQCDALSNLLITGRHAAIHDSLFMKSGKDGCHLAHHLIGIARLVFRER